MKYIPYKRPIYYLVKHIDDGFQYVGLSGRSKLEILKRDAKKLARANYDVIKVMGFYRWNE